MTREEMLIKLRSVEFSYIDPLPDWEDIGFTERPIWVNAQGYGYLSADDPSDQYWIGAALEQIKWDEIRKKLSEGTLQMDDIYGTSLVDLLEEQTYGCVDVESINEDLQKILELPDSLLDCIYAMNSIDGWIYFASEQEFKKAYERDWCDYSWEELDEKILACWIERLLDSDD